MCFGVVAECLSCDLGRLVFVKLRRVTHVGTCIQYSCLTRVMTRSPTLLRVLDCFCDVRAYLREGKEGFNASYRYIGREIYRYTVVLFHYGSCRYPVTLGI